MTICARLPAATMPSDGERNLHDHVEDERKDSSLCYPCTMIPKARCVCSSIETYLLYLPIMPSFTYLSTTDRNIGKQGIFLHVIQPSVAVEMA